MDNCVFCKIVRGDSADTRIEFENEDVIVFKDIRPASEHHYLAVSKQHIPSAKSLKSDDESLLDNLEESLKQVLQEKNADVQDAIFGFHWPPFTSVRHLHLHGIAPVSRMSFIGKWVFRPQTLWFCTLDYVRNRIKSNL